MRNFVYCCLLIVLLACGNDDADYSLTEQSEQVDTFWGDAPEQEERVALFENIWNSVGSNFAAFVTTDVDWDEVYDEYLPQVEEAEGYGRLYQILSEMLGRLQDSHTSIDSTLICEAPQVDRPPYFRTNCL